MSGRSRSSAGFTLIELVVAIVLAAIVAGFVVLFLDAPIQSYFAQTRRSDLVDSANRIAAAITGDVRTALPNSLRATTAGSATALELLATQGVARYYGQGDKNGVGGEELTIGTTATAFGTLESFGPQTLPYRPPFLAIGNLGTATYNAYNSATGVMTGAGTQVTVNPSPGSPFVAGENQVTLSGAPMTFQAPGAPGVQPSVHNAYLVSGPVSYVCDSVAGTLRRYSGYAATTAQAATPPGAGALIAHDVTQCVISFGVPSARYGQLAILTITLSSGGESLRMFLEARTEYIQ